jgi:hypothetical protein
MHIYEVGQLYHPNRTEWPEAVEYNYRAGEHELHLFLADPTPAEIQGVRIGSAEFSLYIERDLLVLLFQFWEGQEVDEEPTPTLGVALPWSDAPYNWWLNAPEDRTLPNPEPTDVERALLHVTLVNARTGIILALRAVTFSPEFTQHLNAAIRRQARTSWDPIRYDKALAALYRRYPTTDAMRHAAAMTCQGGD